MTERSLGQWFPPPVPTFRAALRDLSARFPESRAAAARRLASASDTPAEPGIDDDVVVYGDGDGDVDGGAIDRGGKGAPTGREGAGAAGTPSAPPSERALALRALPQLRALATGDPSGQVRAAALEALGCLGEVAVDGPTLRARALEETDPAAAEEAVLALARLAGPEVAETLIALLEADPRDTACPEAVRFQAAAALPAVDQRRAVEALPRALGDPAEPVRGAVARALASAAQGDQVGLDDCERARAALRDRFELEGAPSVRRHIAFALAELGDDGGVPELIDAVLGDDPATVIEAAEALAALRADDAREALARQAQRLFGHLLVRAATATALVDLGDPRGVPALRAVLTARRPDGRTYAVRAVGARRLTALRPELLALERRPRGADPEVVAEALEALGAS